jgi:outer membrane protein assembly factor BamB
LLLPDGRLIILDEDGKLTMAKPSGKGLEPISQAQVLTSESWTAPSLVGTRLYVRNRAEMAVFELGDPAAKRR